MLHETNEDHKA